MPAPSWRLPQPNTDPNPYLNQNPNLNVILNLNLNPSLELYPKSGLDQNMDPNEMPHFYTSPDPLGLETNPGPCMLLNPITNPGLNRNM